MLPDALQRNVRVFILQRRACKRYRAGQNLSSSRGEVHGNSAKVRARLRNARLQQRFHLQVFKGLGSRLLRKARWLHRDFSRFLDRFCGIADKENAPCYQHVQAKAVLYHILAEFETHTAFIPVDKKKVDVLNAIAKYVSHNFTEDISLKDLSDKMGYSYNYLSAVFNEYFGANFSDVVNIYRINYATDLLYSTTLSVAEISKKAGYDSVRSFNRNFQKYKGKSPRDAREFVKEGIIVDV